MCAKCGDSARAAIHAAVTGDCEAQTIACALQVHGVLTIRTRTLSRARTRERTHSADWPGQANPTLKMGNQDALVRKSRCP